jgi:hypothetical protein
MYGVHHPINIGFVGTTTRSNHILCGYDTLHVTPCNEAECSEIAEQAKDYRDHMCRDCSPLVERLLSIQGLASVHA